MESSTPKFEFNNTKFLNLNSMKLNLFWIYLNRINNHTWTTSNPTLP